MAILSAVKSGNWSDPTVWSTNALPETTDYVMVSTHVVTIDQDIVVAGLSHNNPEFIPPIPSAPPEFTGYFLANSGITISADITGVRTQVIRFQDSFPSFLNIIGNTFRIPTVVTSTPANYVLGAIQNASTGVINMSGIHGGDIYNNGVVNISGSVINGSGSLVNNSTTNIVGTVSGLNRALFTLFNTSTINITGDVTGYNSSVIYINNDSPNINILGNVYNDNGVVNNNIINLNFNTSPKLTIVGDITGGAGNAILWRSSPTGSCSITGDLYSFNGRAIYDTAGSLSARRTDGLADISILGTIRGARLPGITGGTGNTVEPDFASYSTINIVGSCFGGERGAGISLGGGGGGVITGGNVQAGVINLSGAVSGGLGGFSEANGIFIGGNGWTVNVYGHVQNGFSGQGILNNSNNTSVVNIYGYVINILNGYGRAAINNRGNVNVYGTVYGGLNNNIGNVVKATIENNVNCFVYATRMVGNDVDPRTAAGNIGGVAVGTGGTDGPTNTFYGEQFEFGAFGAPPVRGAVNIIRTPDNYIRLATGPNQFVTLYRSLCTPGFAPEPKDVRAGVVYGGGELVGTMIVPSPDSVLQNIRVDAGSTRGRAALSPISVWNLTRRTTLSAGSMGERVRNALTTQGAGLILASYNLSGAS